MADVVGVSSAGASEVGSADVGLGRSVEDGVEASVVVGSELPVVKTALSCRFFILATSSSWAKAKAAIANSNSTRLTLHLPARILNVL